MFERHKAKLHLNNTNMKTVYVLLVVAAFAIPRTKQDKCHLRELDLCAATALVSVRQNPIPQSEEEMDKQCSVITETRDCIQNYTDRCVTKLHRELLSFAGEGPHTTVSQYCTAGSDLRKSILERSSCLAEAWKDQKTCTDDAQAALENLETAPGDKQLDILCCTYRRFRKCSSDLARVKCGEDVENLMENLSGLLVSNLPNLICRSCDNNESKCNGLLPVPGTPPKGSDSNSIFSQLMSMYTS